MRIGLLWSDTTTATLETKLRAAVIAYQRKHRRLPTVCHVHPVPNLPKDIDGIAIRPDGYVLPCDLWLGVEEPAR